jgi:hypothetical protein
MVGPGLAPMEVAPSVLSRTQCPGAMSYQGRASEP